MYWIEERIRHDDYAHVAMIAAHTRTPLQLAENLVGLTPLYGTLKAEATDWARSIWTASAACPVGASLAASPWGPGGW